MIGINYELFDIYIHTLHIEEFYMNKKSKTNINWKEFYKIKF